MSQKIYVLSHSFFSVSHPLTVESRQCFISTDSLECVLEEMKKEIKDNEDEIIQWKISVYENNSSYSCQTLICSKDGVLIFDSSNRKQSFNGIEPSQCRFTDGEIVYSLRSQTFAIIDGLPPTPEEVKKYGELDQRDNVYLIVDEIGQQTSHDHVSEHQMLPLSEIPEPFQLSAQEIGEWKNWLQSVREHQEKLKKEHA